MMSSLLAWSLAELNRNYTARVALAYDALRVFWTALP
jgi:hypothetical protein